jgi:hypothetical protein
VSQREKVRALGRIQTERASYLIQEMGGNIDLATLLQPSIPSDSNSCEMRDFFSPQTGRSTPRSSR